MHEWVSQPSFFGSRNSFHDTNSKTSYGNIRPNQSGWNNRQLVFLTWLSILWCVSDRGILAHVRNALRPVFPSFNKIPPFYTFQNLRKIRHLLLMTESEGEWVNYWFDVTKRIYISLTLRKHAFKVDCDVKSGVDPLPPDSVLNKRCLVFRKFWCP